MITDKELLEHFDIPTETLEFSADGETLEHYGRKGMKWGQNIFKGAKSIGRYTKRKTQEGLQSRRERKARRAEAKLSRMSKRKKEKLAREASVQHIKNVKRLARDVGSLSDADVKALATRLENEAKIRKQAEALSKHLPPSRQERVFNAVKRIGEMPMPMQNFDKKGNPTGWTTDGTVKDFIVKSAINAAVAGTTRKLNTSGVTETANVARRVMDNIKENLDED